MTHDANAMQKFVSIDNIHFQQRIQHIEKEIQFKDGCASQYKSHLPFCDLSYASKDHGFSIERHFYGSRYGKGHSDGAGAVVKEQR